MALGKKHEVKVLLENYTHLIQGEKKVGKSTLVADIARRHYGGLDHLLSISVGDEDGFSAIDGLVYEDPKTWKEFVAIIDELVSNPDGNEFSLISIDTIDELISLGIEEVKRLSRIETKKECHSINDAFGGFGRGREKLDDLISTQIARLRAMRGRYGLFLIGHNKVKTQKEKLGDEYQVLTSNLNSDYFNIFGYKADIICNIRSEREVDDKVLTGTSRWMYFRSDGFVEAGGRFSEMPVRVPFGADQYVESVKEGIRKSLAVQISDDEVKKRASKEKQTAVKHSKHVSESENKETIEDVIVKIKAAFGKATTEQKTSFMEKIKEMGYDNLTGVNKDGTVEDAVELLKLVV